jgi:hypothetical protein
MVYACTGNDKTINEMGAILYQTDEQGKQLSFLCKQTIS